MEKIYTVEEAQDKLFTALADATDFKYLKSKKCLKKIVNNLVFEIDFFSSKWNESYEVINIEASFILMYKKYGKKRVDNVIAEKNIRPESGWYDISTEKKWKTTYNELKKELATVVDLCNRFETDFTSATEYLYNELFEYYNVRIDFLVDNLGINKVKEKIKEMYLDIPIKEREIYVKIGDELNNRLKIGDYTCLRMEGVKNWMVNRNNWKYIMDNRLIELI